MERFLGILLSVKVMHIKVTLEKIGKYISSVLLKVMKK